MAGSLRRYGFRRADLVFSLEGSMPTILARGGGSIGHQVNVAKRRRIKDGELDG